MILGEPTSVLTPAEADEMLGLLKQTAVRGDITVVIITHKFREVTNYADAGTILRRGKQIGGGKVGELSTDEMARMMVGGTPIRAAAERKSLRHDKLGRVVS
jgi:general nucleoside transport system ATP-binding protein